MLSNAAFYAVYVRLMLNLLLVIFLCCMKRFYMSAIRKSIIADVGLSGGPSKFIPLQEFLQIFYSQASVKYHNNIFISNVSVSRIFLLVREPRTCLLGYMTRSLRVI